MCLDSCELVSFVSAAACAVAKNTTDDGLALLAAIFTQLGDSLATIAVSRSRDKPQCAADGE